MVVGGATATAGAVIAAGYATEVIVLDGDACRTSMYVVVPKARAGDEATVVSTGAVVIAPALAWDLLNSSRVITPSWSVSTASKTRSKIEGCAGPLRVLGGPDETDDMAPACGAWPAPGAVQRPQGKNLHAAEGLGKVLLLRRERLDGVPELLWGRQSGELQRYGQLVLVLHDGGVLRFEDGGRDNVAHQSCPCWNLSARSSVSHSATSG